MSTNRRPLAKGFGASDPQQLQDGSKGLKRLIAASKTSGTLNLSNRQLQEVPEDVFRLPEDDDSIKWWEVVDIIKIDVSHNCISELPSGLTQQSALVTLLASNNQLQGLPQGFSSLQSLRMLELSDNPLGPRLPEDLALLPSLATLNCSNCGLEQLPGALGGKQQPKLSVLNVGSNALTRLPEGLAAASALVVLKASNNQLAELPGGLVKGWASLKELDVTHNKLQELPAELGSLPCLSSLDARNNQLSTLPAGLGSATALCELRVGFNKLSSVPDTLGMLGNLRSLDLRNNTIEELPDALCGLQLVLLDLTNNCLRRLPPALGHMTSLRSIPLDGNPLKLMRRELWAGPVSALLQHLRDQEQQHSDTAAQAASTAGGAPKGPGGSSCGLLDASDGSLSLRGRRLTSVPVEVWQVVGITSLDLSDNALASDSANIAAGLSQLPGLKVLAVNSCGLSSWPLSGLSPGSLHVLHTLELRGNAFGGCVPADALAPCPRLRSLELSGVSSLQLPAGMFAHTPQLEVLAACRAGLTEFPAAVLEAPSLLQLGLASNSLSIVPTDVTRLTRLQELDLQNNQLSNLPPQMGLMAPTLRVLLLEGNCIRVIRRPVLEKGTAAVLEWLKDRIPL